MSAFSLFGGMRAAVSGLFAQSQSLGMIGDNIANVNTHGYKAVRNGILNTCNNCFQSNDAFTWRSSV